MPNCSFVEPEVAESTGLKSSGPTIQPNNAGQKSSQTLSAHIVLDVVLLVVSTVLVLVVVPILLAAPAAHQPGHRGAAALIAADAPLFQLQAARAGAGKHGVIEIVGFPFSIPIVNVVILQSRSEGGTGKVKNNLPFRKCHR